MRSDAHSPAASALTTFFCARLPPARGSRGLPEDAGARSSDAHSPVATALCQDRNAAPDLLMGRLEYVGIPTADTARSFADRHSFHPALCCDASLTGPSLVSSRAPSLSQYAQWHTSTYRPISSTGRPIQKRCRGSLPLLSRFLCHGVASALCLQHLSRARAEPTCRFQVPRASCHYRVTRETQKAICKQQVPSGRSCVLSW